MLIPTILIAVCVSTAAQVLDLYEGDDCKQKDGVVWTCKLLKDCPKNQEYVRQGQRPEICGFKGSHVITCCEPDAKPPQAVGQKAKDMCKKYGEEVYMKLADPLGEGFITYDTCAFVESLIINGINAEAREYPHMALIGYGDKNAIEWLCGGSLISERYVLSAAHCTDGGKKGKPRWVRLGEYNIHSTRDDRIGLSQPEEYEIIQIIIHPEYMKRSFYNDIALYKLNKNVQFNEYIRPICLQTDHQFSKTYAIGTGWGRNSLDGKQADILKKLNLTIIPNKSCNNSYNAVLGAKLKDGILDAKMICAGDILNGKDMCQGDSGGPLQIQLKDPYCMYSQVGITSFGSKCGLNKPGVYTRVSAYVAWIENILWP